MNADFKAIALKLGLPETATETEILARIGILQGPVSYTHLFSHRLTDWRLTPVSSTICAVGVPFM